MTDHKGNQASDKDCPIRTQHERCSTTSSTYLLPAPGDELQVCNVITLVALWWQTQEIAQTLQLFKTDLWAFYAKYTCGHVQVTVHTRPAAHIEWASCFGLPTMGRQERILWAQCWYLIFKNMAQSNVDNCRGPDSPVSGRGERGTMPQKLSACSWLEDPCRSDSNLLRSIWRKWTASRSASKSPSHQADPSSCDPLKGQGNKTRRVLPVAQTWASTLYASKLQLGTFQQPKESYCSQTSFSKADSFWLYQRCAGSNSKQWFCLS